MIYTICTLREMADRLSIHPDTLYRMIRKKQYPGVYFIGPKAWGYRFNVEEFLAALREEGSKYARE